jgi:hypothetical protein
MIPNTGALFRQYWHCPSTIPITSQSAASGAIWYEHLHYHLHYNAIYWSLIPYHSAWKWLAKLRLALIRTPYYTPSHYSNPVISGP